MTDGLAQLPKEPADRFTGPFPRFVRIEAMAGAVLFLCALGIEAQVTTCRRADGEGCPGGGKGPVSGGCEAAQNRHRTTYIWRRRFGALGSQEVRRLCELEAENTRLKKLVAERLEIEVMTAA